MVLDHERASANACRFPYQRRRTPRVVHDINHHHSADSAVREVDKLPVKAFNGYCGSRPEHHIDPTHPYVGSHIHHCTSDLPVTATDVEYIQIARQQTRDAFSKDADAPLHDRSAMYATNCRPEPNHFRRSPRMLRKKLPMIASAPSTISVTDGITSRSVCSGSSGPKDAVRHPATAANAARSPAPNINAPTMSPVSSVITRNSRSNRGSIGRSPSLTANTFANVANNIACHPRITAAAQNSSEFRSKVTLPT